MQSFLMLPQTRFSLFQGGIYSFQIVDYYAAAMSLMYIAFFECVAIVWIYGTKRMSANIKDMTGSYPNFIFRLLWQYISPLLILGLWFFSVTDYKEPTYNKGSYIYPPWAIILGWCIAGTSLAPIPLMAIFRILTAKANSLYTVSIKSQFSILGWIWSGKISCRSSRKAFKRPLKLAHVGVKLD